MRTYDLTPFYRSTVGFDRFFNLLDQATADGSPGYPPYNIERTGENAYRISVAVSGFSQGELSIVAKENTLTIKGEKSANENGKDNSEVLYRGIAARAFERVFQLADFVQVKNASLENGLLHVDLVREIPEAKKPRSIPINSGAKAPQVVDGSVKGRRLTQSGFRPILAERENAPGNRGVFLSVVRCERRTTVEFTPAPAPSAFPGSAQSTGAGLARSRPVVAGGGVACASAGFGAGAQPPAATGCGWRRLGGERAGLRHRHACGSRHGPAVTDAASAWPDPAPEACGGRRLRRLRTRAARRSALCSS